MTKAQFSLEFILIFVVAFLIFLSLLALLTTMVEDRRSETAQVRLDILADGIKQYVQLAHQSTTRFEASVTLPPDLEGMAYNVSVDLETALVVFSEESKVAAYKNIPAMQGQFQKGCNRLVKKEDVIRVVPC